MLVVGGGVIAGVAIHHRRQVGETISSRNKPAHETKIEAVQKSENRTLDPALSPTAPLPDSVADLKELAREMEESIEQDDLVTRVNEGNLSAIEIDVAHQRFQKLDRVYEKLIHLQVQEAEEKMKKLGMR